jgi:hypothetical protein
MNMKKALPVILLIILAVVALALKRCNQPAVKNGYNTSRQQRTARPDNRYNSNQTQYNGSDKVPFDRNTTNLYFTKHAKCRMACRDISEDEVIDILKNGKVNYRKSNLQDAKGPTYALEGATRDGQEVRIIFAPKQSHLTVVTVIDLGVEHVCDCT